MARTYTLTLQDRAVEVEVFETGSGLSVRLGDAVHVVSLAPIDEGRLFSLLIDGQSYEIYAQATRDAYSLLVGNELFDVQVERGRRSGRPAPAVETAGPRVVRSPMAGIVASVAVAMGDAVERETVLLVLESMKMNNELHADAAGTVEQINVTPGQRVERGDLLLRLASR